jgi:RNA polymerase sigma-70 factor, ECF subfamily
MTDRQLLRSAQAGDEDAFGRLAAPFRAELYAHCYRMLASAADAEDAVQDTLLRAWRALPRFEGRSSLRSWLYRIATNVCLRAIERRPPRVLPIDFGPAADPHEATARPLVESVWIEPYPDDHLVLADGFATPEARYEQREGVELAFTAALQHLPARQRAVLILRDVLGFSAREVAEALETTPASIDSALQRAHKTVEGRIPERTQQATLRSLEDGELRAMVDRFREAWERADVDAIKSMLAEDAIFSMPPWAEWYSGVDTIAEFLRRGPLTGKEGWRTVPTRANGQAAFAQYMWKDYADRFVPHAICILTLRGDEISEVTTFRTPSAFARFELPEEILD